MYYDRFLGILLKLLNHLLGITYEYLCALKITVIVERRFKMLKKVAVLMAIVLALSACGSDVAQADYDKITAESAQYQKELEEAKKELENAKTELEKSQADLGALQKEFDAYKEKMKPFEEMTAAQAEAEKAKAEEEKRQLEEAEAQRKAEEEAAKKAEEEAAAAAAAAEEAKGYETGITYNQLARTPDDYKGKKVKFSGKVIQVIEGDGRVNIRLAVNDDYDTILFCEYESGIVSSRVLDDDHITIYGTSYGLYSYQSTMGGTITIPAVVIDKIDQ